MNSAFEEQLRIWGPEAEQSQPLSPQAAERYCRELAVNHYENFPVVSRMLPRHLRSHFYNVYAFCRWADDLGDETGDPTRSLALLQWWRELLDNCYAGNATHPAFIALQGTIQQFKIPQQPFADLISAFEQDQRIMEYESFEQLLDYCTRSANPVGRLVLYLCNTHTPENVMYSDSICTGLQLANFWQDVDRDADIGRCYLPRADRMQFGYSDDDLAARTTNGAFIKLMQFEVERAEQFLRDGLPLINNMPGRLQIDIDLFIQGGLKILQRIRQIEYNVWKTRPVVTKTDGLLLMSVSLFRFLKRKLLHSR